MSQDNRKDTGLGPDWMDDELDWLNDLLSERPGASKPVRPTQTARSAPARTETPRPTETRRTAPSASSNDADFWKAAFDDAASSYEEEQSAPAREQPARRAAEERRARQTRAAQPSQRSRRTQPAREEEYYREERRSRSAQRSRRARDPEEDYERYRSGRSYDEPRRRKTSAPLILLIILLVGGMCFAGWQLASIFLNYHRDRSAYNDLATHAITGLAEARGQTTVTPAPAQPEATPFVSQIPITVDWNYLRSVNSSVIGWLYSPGTVINYPVVQTNDHEYYLTHGFNGESNVAGTLFADKNSVPGITQSNLIIYGHNMKDGSMFGSITNYGDESYYREHPVMYFLTPNGSYRVNLIGARVMNASVDNYPTYFGDSGTYQAYLNQIGGSFLWINRDALRTDRQLITLSTCTADEDDRLVLQGTLEPIQ